MLAATYILLIYIYIYFMKCIYLQGGMDVMLVERPPALNTYLHTHFHSKFRSVVSKY